MFCSPAVLANRGTWEVENIRQGGRIVPPFGYTPPKPSSPPLTDPDPKGSLFWWHNFYSFVQLHPSRIVPGGDGGYATIEGYYEVREPGGGTHRFWPCDNRSAPCVGDCTRARRASWAS